MRTVVIPLFVVLWALAPWAGLRADTVRLVNGDTVQGRVVSLDEKELKVQSSLLGALTIAREKVQVIGLGDTPLAAPVATPGEDAVAEHLKSLGVDPQAFQPGGARPFAGKKAEPTEGVAGDVIRQLQAQGLDPQLKRQIQQTLPLLAAPEVQKYFDTTVSGLAGGQLNVQDIRKDAIQARDQLLGLQKDLGSKASPAIAPYLGILNKFIDETDPGEKPAGKPVAPKPGKRSP